MSLRRSDRQRKQTNFYVPTVKFYNQNDSDEEEEIEPETTGTRKSKPIIEYDDDDDSKLEKNIQSRKMTEKPRENERNAQKKKSIEKENMDDDGKDDHGKNVNVPNIIPAKSKHTEKKKVVTSRKQTISESIFDNLNSSISPKLCVGRWAEAFKANRPKALVDIINFVLQSAGAKPSCIESDVDMEGLDEDELAELLSEVVQELTGDASTAGMRHPLEPVAAHAHSKQPNKPSFRSLYCEFWSILADTLRSAGDEDAQGLQGLHCLETVLDRLSALSRSSIVNIRDAVNEAVLTCATRLVVGRVELQQRVDSTKRQLNAELQKNSGHISKAKGSLRYQAIDKQLRRAQEMLKSTCDLLDATFASVLALRVKDVHEKVRATSMRRLAQCIMLDATGGMLCDDYLKYVGWGCSDHQALVRREAVRAITSIAELAEWPEAVEVFVERFMGRFVEIAVGDVDQEIALDMFGALRTMYQRGRLDWVNEDHLDQLDGVVFDTGAGETARVQALEFFFDHTQGFDSDPTGQDGSPAGLSSVIENTRRKMVTASGGGEGSSLLRQWAVALQLETLTEFMEHHLEEGQEAHVQLLVSACLQSEKQDLVHEWATIFSLLLRDGEYLVAAPLRPRQTQLLLHLVSHSASILRVSHTALLEQKASIVNNRSHKRKADDEARLSKAWRALTTALHSDGPNLIEKFTTDSSDTTCIQTDLCLVADVLLCADINGPAATVKSRNTLIKTVCDVFETTADEKAPHRLAELLSEWHKQLGPTTALGEFYGVGAGPGHTSDITRSVSNLLQLFWTRAVDTFQAIIDSASSTSLQLTSSAFRNKKEKRQFEDSVYSLDSSLRKCETLWKVLDCREIASERGYDDSVICEFAESLSQKCLSILHTDSKFGNEDSTKMLVSASCHCIEILRQIVLWRFRDILWTRREGREQVHDRDLVEKIENLLKSRTRMLDILETWMVPSDHEGEFNENQLQLATMHPRRILHRYAFALVNYTRTLFPTRYNHFHIGDHLAYAPSTGIVSGLRYVFELEGNRLKAEIQAAEASGDEAESKRLANLHSKDLLHPLSASFMFDVQNLNRRQAAAVLCHLLESHPDMLSQVRNTMKCLKDADAVKCLEVQLVALRSTFAERVAAPTRARQEAESALTQGGQFDFEQSELDIEDGMTIVSTLAKRFASTLGVGKLKDATLIEALEKFAQLGIDHMFEEDANIGFAAALEPYLRFLPPKHHERVSVYLKNKCEMIYGLDNQLLEPKTSLSSELKALVTLKEKLGLMKAHVKSKGGKRKVADVGDADDDEDYQVNGNNNRARGPSRRSGPSWGAAAADVSVDLQIDRMQNMRNNVQGAIDGPKSRTSANASRKHSTDERDDNSYELNQIDDHGEMNVNEDHDDERGEIVGSGGSMPVHRRQSSSRNMLSPQQPRKLGTRPDRIATGLTLEDIESPLRVLEKHSNRAHVVTALSSAGDQDQIDRVDDEWERGEPELSSDDDNSEGSDEEIAMMPRRKYKL